jgi:hypothetical protein
MLGQDISSMWTILIGLMVIALIVILSFLFARRTSSPPSRLRLHVKSSESSRTTQAPLLGMEGPLRDNVTNLNVMFNYNGHSWDAYEVLGLQAGASLDAVRDNFNKAIQECKPQSHDFIKAALEAILKDRAS